MILMKKIILLLLAVNFSFAQQGYPELGNSIVLPSNESKITYLFLYDGIDETPISTALVNLVITIKGRQYTTDILSDHEGKLGIELVDDENISLDFRVDLLSTPGKDYYGEYELKSKKDELRVELFRVGTIRGRVLDTLDNIVPNAEMQFHCDSSQGDIPPVWSDKFGAFYYDYAPMGNCRVYARYQTQVGFEDVFVKQGEVNEVILRLEQNLIKTTNILPSYLLFILLAVIVFLFVRPKGKSSQQKRAGRRIEDILVTLNHKEKNIVKYLMEKKGDVSQNELSREVGIPKTSLRRVIESLEQKKVIQSQNIGKFKKIRLSDWFLNR